MHLREDKDEDKAVAVVGVEERPFHRRLRIRSRWLYRCSWRGSAVALLINVNLSRVVVLITCVGGCKAWGFVGRWMRVGIHRLPVWD